MKPNLTKIFTFLFFSNKKVMLIFRCLMAAAHVWKNISLTRKTYDATQNIFRWRKCEAVILWD